MNEIINLPTHLHVFEAVIHHKSSYRQSDSMFVDVEGVFFCFGSREIIVQHWHCLTDIQIGYLLSEALLR